MLSTSLSAFQPLLHRHPFEDGMAEEMRFHIEQYTDDLVRSGVPPAEAARRARMEFGSLDNAKDGLPRGARPAPLRRAASEPALCRPPAAQDAGLHGHRPGDPGALPRSEPDHLRRRRFGPAASAAVSRRRPADERVQHLSEGRRPQRRLLADQLLRAPGPDPRLRVGGGLPRRHGRRRRDRRHGIRTDHARVPGLLLYPGARAGDGARVHGSGDHVADRRRRHRHGRLLAATPRTAIRR